ncbi:MAG: hypothetical protein K0R51_2413 [Cytophagaceae bacterium]|nr:hypothetical protein [Cytophagaceae bacterium]
MLITNQKARTDVLCEGAPINIGASIFILPIKKIARHNNDENYLLYIKSPTQTKYSPPDLKSHTLPYSWKPLLIGCGRV